MPIVSIERISQHDHSGSIGADWIDPSAVKPEDARRSLRIDVPRWCDEQFLNFVPSANKRPAPTRAFADESAPKRRKRTLGGIEYTVKPLSGKKRRDATTLIDETLYTDELPETAKIELDVEESPIYRELSKRRKLNYNRLIDDINVSLELEQRQARQAVTVPKTYELFSNDIYQHVVGQGDQCLAHLRRVLDEFGMKRHSNQIHFHDEMLRACLRKIYQYDYEQNIDRVLKENGWPKMVQEVLVITARRIGTRARPTRVCRANSSPQEKQQPWQCLPPQ